VQTLSANADFHEKNPVEGSRKKGKFAVRSFNLGRDMNRWTAFFQDKGRSIALQLWGKFPSHRGGGYNVIAGWNEYSRKKEGAGESWLGK